METFKMSGKEINQTTVFEQLNKKGVKQKYATKMLTLSIRQIQRKIKIYRRDGPKSLIHKLRGKISNHHLDEKLKIKALALVKKKYPDFGPTLASEKLEEYDSIVIYPATLRQVMIKGDMWKSKTRKARHREWRPRKECLGEMVQFDGSPHDWFESRAPKCTLLAFIDDATSCVMSARFAEQETTLASMKLTKDYLKTYGRPIEIYADRGKVVKVNQNNPDDEFKTQYRRAVEDELGIQVSFALSPQAKGRIERLFKTLQDRLIKEMRLRNISSMKQANEFLKTYLPIHNARFSVAAKEKTDLHRKIRGYNLDDILCIKKQRILKNDFTIRYNNQWYQLQRKQPTLIFPKNIITVSEHLDKRITLSIRKVKLSFSKIFEQSRSVLKVKSQSKKINKKPWIPAVDHPWRKYNKLTFQHC